MMKTNIEDIKHIRSMMERSTKFLSLSGMAGILAGVFALVGATLAYFILIGSLSITGDAIYDLLLVAIAVIMCASTAGYYFSAREAKKNGAKFWMPITWRILKDFSVPMCVGGVVCVILVYHDYLNLLAPAMLIFYGLALIAAGAHTYYSIKILGAIEITLGVISSFTVGGTLVFWAIGFGVLHIIYGVVAYTRQSKKTDRSRWI